MNQKNFFWNVIRFKYLTLFSHLQNYNSWEYKGIPWKLFFPVPNVLMHLYARLMSTLACVSARVCVGACFPHLCKWVTSWCISVCRHTWEPSPLFIRKYVCVCVCVHIWLRAGFWAREQKHFFTGDGSLRVSSTLILFASYFPFNQSDVFFPLAKSPHRLFFFFFPSLLPISFDLITATCCRLPAIVSRRTASASAVLTGRMGETQKTHGNTKHTWAQAHTCGGTAVSKTDVKRWQLHKPLRIMTWISWSKFCLAAMLTAAATRNVFIHI